VLTKQKTTYADTKGNKNGSKSMHLQTPICPMVWSKRNCKGCSSLTLINPSIKVRRQIETKQRSEKKKLILLRNEKILQNLQYKKI